MKPGEYEAIQSMLDGLVGCMIVAVEGDGHEDLTLCLNDGTYLYVGDPTGDQGIILSREKEKCIVSEHVSTTGCNLTREDFGNGPSRQCEDGGWPYQHPTRDEADLIEALEYHGDDVVNEGTAAALVRYGSAESKAYPGDNWDYAAIVRLTSGRFAALSGGYDYTGWSCQAGLSITVHNTEQEAWLNLPTDDRAMIERAEEVRGQ